jgi:hypothetical protein
MTEPLSNNIDVWIIIIIVSLSFWSLPYLLLCCCHGKFLVKQVWLLWFCSGILIGLLWHILGYEWRGHRYWGDGKDGNIRGYSPWTSTYTTPSNTLLVVPSSEKELRDAVLKQKRPLRVVGSGHSWSATGYTDGTIIDLKHLKKVIHFTSTNITVEAGMKVQDCVQFLFRFGYCLHGVGSIRAQAIGGVVSHGVHGPHPDGFNRHVIGLKVLLANGTFLDIRSERHLHMWRSSIGLLGVIVQVTLNIFPLEWLSLKNSPIKSYEDLNDLVKHLREGQTFTGYLYPSMYCSKNIGWKRIGTPIRFVQGLENNLILKNQTDFGSRLMLHFNDHMHPPIQYVSWGILGNVVGCIEQILADLEHSTLLSGLSEDVLPNDGLIPQFYEIIDYEYMIPLRNCKTFAKELIWQQKYGRILIPICLRLMRGEHSCLSMAEEDSCVFGIESMRGMAYTLDILAIEQRVAELGGFAHFGKVAPGNFQFYKYNCMESFKEYRKEMDPNNAFLTPYLATILERNESSKTLKKEFDPVKKNRSKSIHRSKLFAFCVWIIGILSFYFTLKSFRAHKNKYELLYNKITSYG